MLTISMFRATAVLTAALFMIPTTTIAQTRRTQPPPEQQPPVQQQPASIDEAAAAELAAAEEALAEAEAAARAAEAEAEAAARAAEAEAAAAAAADIVNDAERLVLVPHRRSMARTTTGVIVTGLGVFVAYAGYVLAEEERSQARSVRYDDWYDQTYVDQVEKTADRYAQLGYGVGLPLIVLGVLTATIWADVPDRERMGVAVNVSPDGGVRVSKSFGW